MTKITRHLILLTSLYLLISAVSCDKKDFDPVYRERMREFVADISDYAKVIHPGFLVIPQNGIELVSDNGDEDGDPVQEYLSAIDANGQEDLFYGYKRDDKATPADERDYLISFLNMSKNNGNTILVTDYCSSHDNMDDSYTKNAGRGFISFAANHRELDNIPSYPAKPYQENAENINSISQVKNFLYLLNPENYHSKNALIEALTSTSYDLLIIDLFYSENEALTADDLIALKQKANGGSRLAVAYMSIGEAEEYRYYWQRAWLSDKPSWLDKENPDWEGNYKVKYWDPAWQEIIFGTEDSYLKKILDAGFDGVYLDIIEAYEYYE